MDKVKEERDEVEGQRIDERKKNKAVADNGSEEERG